MLVFDKSKPIRIEDLIRKSKFFVIQKGSFNPLHHGHVELMNKSIEKYKNSLPAFLIGTYRYDKPHITIEELLERIEIINKAGYPLIICKSILFYQTFDLLNEWSYKNEFLFPMGTDTLNRIYLTDVDYVNTVNGKNVSKIGLKAEITIRGYINNIIRKFPNFKFLIHNRKGYAKIEDTNLYGSMVSEIEEYVDDGISSTAIREGIAKNKLDSHD